MRRVMLEPTTITHEGFLEQPRVEAEIVVPSIITAAESAAQPSSPWEHLALGRIVRWPFWLLARSWELTCLLVLLAVVSAMPLVQLAALGYLLAAAARLARGGRWSQALPGRRTAGQLGTFAAIATLTWLPVWLVTDVSYSAQLLQPGTTEAAMWRWGAFAVTTLWGTYVGWAAIRGGRWWHFLWPAPLRFVKSIWRQETWLAASESLYNWVSALHFVQLWWLGARAALGALVWTCIPVSMMIIGQRADDFRLAAVVGLLGAVAMGVIMLYLPFLQIQLAISNRFASMGDVLQVRRRFLYAPLAHAVALLLLCVLCIPLYLLRIEATPSELLWAPSLVFVVFMLPSKLMLGAAMGYAERRRWHHPTRLRTRFVRWPARLVALASVVLYVGSLYVAQLVAGQGALVMYFQHAFLVPAPLISS